MQAIYNPFTVLPDALCDTRLPAITPCQDTVTHIQRRSEVCGLFLLPIGADRPGSWQAVADWESVVDNESTDNTKAKYIVGRGSFLLESQVQVNLSGGRLELNKEKTYRLVFNVVNIDDGHSDLFRKLENGVRNFDFWILTVGDRLIGGPRGMRPRTVNATFALAEGGTSREVWQIVLTTTLHQFPEMTAQAIDFTGSGLSGGTGGGGDTDIQTLLSGLPSYINDADAIADGLSAGDAYWVLPGNDIQPADSLRRVPA